MIGKPISLLLQEEPEPDIICVRVCITRTRISKLMGQLFIYL